MRISLKKIWNKLSMKIIGFSSKDDDYKKYNIIKKKYGFAPAKLKIYANGAWGYEKKAFIGDPKVARVIYRNDKQAILDLDTYLNLKKSLEKRRGVWQSIANPL